MSMLGLIVGTTSVISIRPSLTTRVRMSLRFDPMISWWIGTPICFATHPESTLPKLPLGTTNDTGCASVAPSEIAEVT